MSVYVNRYNRSKKQLDVNLLLVLLLLRVTMHSIQSNKPLYVLSSLPKFDSIIRPQLFCPKALQNGVVR